MAESRRANTYTSRTAWEHPNTREMTRRAKRMETPKEDGGKERRRRWRTANENKSASSASAEVPRPWMNGSGLGGAVTFADDTKTGELYITVFALRLRMLVHTRFLWADRLHLPCRPTAGQAPHHVIFM